MAVITFTEIDQMALRYAGWRVSTTIADRAWPGEIIATIYPSARWIVTEKGKTADSGTGDNPVVCALVAFDTAVELKTRRLLAQMV